MPLLDANIKEMRDVYELNVFSVLAVTQALAPSIIAAKGKVINIGSIVGRIAQPYSGMFLLLSSLGVDANELVLLKGSTIRVRLRRTC